MTSPARATTSPALDQGKLADALDTAIGWWQHTYGLNLPPHQTHALRQHTTIAVLDWLADQTTSKARRAL